MTAWKKLLMACVPFGLIAAIGCNQTTTQDDVRAAREEFRQEHQEAKEAKQKADEKTEKEVKEAIEAKEKYEKTQADFNSEQVRKDFVAKMERRLEDMDSNIKDLKDHAGKLEGEPKDKLNEAIDRIEDKRDAANDKLKELKAAKVEDWPVKRDDVERAMTDAELEIKKAQTTA